MSQIETRQVVPAAYLGPNKGHCRMLTHAVVVNRDGYAMEVLCRRVSIHSIDDRCASDPTEPVTCEYCQRALRKRHRPAPPRTP